jgi:hypothetical protein
MLRFITMIVLPVASAFSTAVGEWCQFRDFTSGAGDECGLLLGAAAH